jgi:2-C-methyl-D-erythritol 2,4-cyclodiphosphate synthase
MRGRVGLGYDIHRLEEGRALYLGGEAIPHDKGLLGHSDADVLLHALIDALLGAAGFGDIGELFPDSDPRFKDITSTELLRQVRVMIDVRYEIGNIDIVVIAEEPKLVQYKRQIKESIARILGIPVDVINVKAKTNEGLDSLGESKAIAAFATVIVFPVS